jgi:hypothetical protein
VGDAPPPDADLGALSASLHSDARDSTVFFGVLCTALEGALPASTTVERRHGMVRSRRLPWRLSVRLGDDTFAAELREGRVVCRQVHAVQGVGGGLPYSKDLNVEEWIAALVAAIAHDADATAAATAALRSLIT